MGVDTRIESFQASLAQYTFRLCRNRALAGEIVRLTVKLARERKPRELRGWAFSKATRLVNSSLSMGRSDVLRLIANDIDRALEALDRDEKLTLLLHEAGLSYGEISYVVGVSRRAVPTLLTRAQKQFLRVLKSSASDARSEVSSVAHI